MNLGKSVRIGVAIVSVAVCLAPAVGRTAPAAPTITVSPTTLTPYHTGGCWNPGRYPCYTVRGTADPGVKVTVTVTDDPASGLSVVASTFAAAEGDPGTGIQPGDWRIAPPSVTELGTHGMDPSTLVFTAVAQGSDGSTSSPTPFTVTKTAATPGDTTAPRTITGTPMPLTIWSRTCVQQCGVGGGQTSACLATPTPPLNPERPLEFLPRGCSGEWVFIGRVEDDVQGAHGIASEIADVKLTILRSSDQVVWQEHHTFTRRSTQAFFKFVLKIQDFVPLTSYDWIITAVDAAGNEADPVVGTFLVSPI